MPYPSVYEEAVEFLAQGPPSANLSQVPRWIMEPFPGEFEWIDEHFATHPRRWIEHDALSRLGGAAGLYAVWFAWESAVETAESVLPFSSFHEGPFTVLFEGMQAVHPVSRERTEALPLILELVNAGLESPMEEEEKWDQLEIILSRVERNHPWFQDLWFSRDLVVEAALWYALRRWEAAVPAALESIERNIAFGDVGEIGTERWGVRFLEDSLHHSVKAIDFIYTEQDWRFLSPDPELTAGTPMHRRWMGFDIVYLLLLARWWNEVKRRMPLRDVIRPDSPDILT